MKKFETFDDFHLYVENYIFTKMIECVNTTDYINGYSVSKYLYCTFDTGGVTGGSCWGDDTHKYDGDSVDYDVFNNLFFTIFDDDKIIDDIKKNYINEEDDIEYGMYGDYRDVTRLIIDLKLIYENLISIKAQRLKKLNIIFNK